LAKEKRQQANQDGHGAETFQRTDEEVIEIRGRKGLSHAMRKRVAEMHLKPPRFVPLKGQMYPLTANEIPDDSEQRQSGVDAFHLKPKKRSYAMSTKRDLAVRQKVRELLKLEQKTRRRDHTRHCNKPTSCTWMNHFRQHHTVWRSNYIVRYVLSYSRK
jgi:hypothetical protein